MCTIKSFARYRAWRFLLWYAVLIVFLLVSVPAYCTGEPDKSSEESAAIMERIENLEKLNDEAEALMQDGEYKKANEIYSTILRELQDPALRAYIEKKKYAHEKAGEIEKAVAGAKVTQKKREKVRAKTVKRRKEKAKKERERKIDLRETKGLSPGEKRARRKELAFQKELNYYLMGADYIKDIMKKADYFYERGEFVEAEKLYEKARELSRERAED